MCGIAGEIRFDDRPVEPKLLTEMADLQRHRGPDGEGYHQADRVGLAFRRLAILDLTAAGNQPMMSADGTCWLIFNGEVYNHDELRCELKHTGYPFRSTSDTEVILAAYQRWGVECLSRFNGMWSFALWDSIEQRLFCARDRLGIKPFYYHVNGDRLLFASEIKALLADPATPCVPDLEAVYAYLVFGHVHFGETTFFRDIRQLPPACYMMVDATGVRLSKYWQLDHSRFDPKIGDDDAIEAFRDLFVDSVRLRLQSDVPVGTCLSGGLDSSAIVCVANKILFGNERPDRTVVGERQKTFSACYVDPALDERRWIAPVIASTGAQSHEVFPSSEGLFHDLEALTWHQDEPVGSSSIYAQWCVMRRARAEGVVVMLDGQGGDEVMAGYQPYYWAYLAGLIRSLRLVAFARASTKPWGVRVTPTGTDLLGVAYATMPLPLQDKARALRAWQAKPWLGDAFSSFHGAPQRPRSGHPTYLGQVLELELSSTSLPDLLKYEDRNSMAHSIEARVPFLDYRLVELMVSLPDRMKIRDGKTKWLLREALEDTLPPQVARRRSKLGFTTPEPAWLTEGWTRLREVLRDSQLARLGWVKSDAIKTHVPSTPTAARARGTDRHLLWRWLNLETWLRVCLR